MKKIFLATIVLLGTWLLVACAEQETPHVSKEVFDYQGTLVGDSSGVGRILVNLEADFEVMILHTDEAPYGIELSNSNMASDEYLTISTILFTLIPNLDWIHYQNEIGKLVIYRNQVNEFLNSEIEFESEAELRDFLQEKLEENGVPSFVLTEEQ